MANSGKRILVVAKKAADKATGKVGGDVPGPSASPMTNLILADFALRTGGALLRRGVEKGLIGGAVGAAKAGGIIKGRTMVQTLVGTALARIASRSVPGAIVVGGGLLAKTLYDRKRERQATTEGTVAVNKQAKRGAAD